MPRMLVPLADWVRAQPLLRRAAHTLVRLIPDVPYTVRRFPEIGPLRIRLRRHRWYLWESFGRNDEFMLGVFNRLIRPGDVVYDIGANIGIYTRMMRAWFGASQVIAFEPMRENFDLLRANIQLGHLQDSVRAFAIALSDEAGEQELQIDDMTSGTAVLNSVSGGEASDGRKSFGLPPKSETVRVARLDDFIEQENLRPPQMMKIDTEGAEAKVLTGARYTLKTHKPRLAIALHGPDKARDTLRILDTLGYHAFGYVVDPESRHPGSVWRQLRAVDAEILGNNNIVASTDLEDVRTEIHEQTGPRRT